MRGRLAPVAVAAMIGSYASAETIGFRCSFDGVCNPDATTCGAADLGIFFKLDTETNTVERVGSDGVSKISAVYGDRAVSFVEIPISGGVSTTTIVLDTSVAVHSSHALDGTLVAPRQYFGTCVAF